MVDSVFATSLVCIVNLNEYSAFDLVLTEFVQVRQK